MNRRTALVTGASSGIGRQTVLYFQEKGWNVIATMRRPEAETELGQLANVLCLPLDVTNEASIVKALGEGRRHFGTIDAVVNNAGYGLVGPFEEMTPEQLRRQFDTNVFGLMSVVRHAIPLMREQGGGTIINVSSMGGRITIPLYSAYHASKWAVEGFTESLAFELESFGIRMKLIEPGATRTDFYDRSFDRGTQTNGSDTYRDFTEAILAQYERAGHGGTDPRKVAKTILRAACDSSRRLRYPVGIDARSLLVLRTIVPERVFRWIVRLAIVTRAPRPDSGRGVSLREGWRESASVEAQLKFVLKLK